jgi:hypothetical protein
MKIIWLVFVFSAQVIENPIQHHQEDKKCFEGVYGYATEIYYIRADINADGKADYAVTNNMLYDPKEYHNIEEPDNKMFVWQFYIARDSGYSKCTRLEEFSFTQAFVGHVPGWDSTNLFILSRTNTEYVLQAIVYEGADIEDKTVRTFYSITGSGDSSNNEDSWIDFFKENKADIITLAVAPYWVGTEEEDSHVAMKDGEVSGTTDVISPSIAEAYAPEDTPPKEPERIVAETAPMTKERPDAIAEIFDAAAKTREEGASAEHQTQDIADSRFPLYGLGVAGIILGAVSFWGYRRIRCGAGRPKGQGKT